MNKKSIFYFLSFITLLTGCSNFDEQEFTVLLPNAGEDQVVFTEETGTTIQLNGASSSDVNNIGFEYLWEIIEFPEGFPAVLSNENIASPTLELPLGVAGRYELQLSVFIGDQIAFDVVNIDINPANAQILLVNAIDDTNGNTATLSIPAIDLIGSPVTSKTTEDTYYNIDTNIAPEDDGTTIINVDYTIFDEGGTLQEIITIATNQTLEALKSYTLYLVGTIDNPEILFIEKTRNQNTIGLGLVALDVINLTEGSDDVLLFIDAGTFGGILPLDVLLSAQGFTEVFGTLNYQDNSEIFFPTASLNPFPIWATINGERISNDTVIGLTDAVDGDFGTFMLFPDALSELGHTLIFVNNTELLPL